MSLSTLRSQTTPKTSCTRSFAQVVEEADVVAQAQQVVVQGVVEVDMAVVRLELLRGFLREAARPRHVGRLFAVEDGANHVAFGH